MVKKMKEPKSYKAKEILEKILQKDTDDFCDRMLTLITNCITYAEEHNCCIVNYTARELFADVLTEEELAECFDEEY